MYFVTFCTLIILITSHVLRSTFTALLIVYCSVTRTYQYSSTDSYFDIYKNQYIQWTYLSRRESCVFPVVFNSVTFFSWRAPVRFGFSISIKCSTPLAFLSPYNQEVHYLCIEGKTSSKQKVQTLVLEPFKIQQSCQSLWFGSNKRTLPILGTPQKCCFT